METLKQAFCFLFHRIHFILAILFVSLLILIVSVYITLNKECSGNPGLLSLHVTNKLEPVFHVTCIDAK